MPKTQNSQNITAILPAHRGRNNKYKMSLFSELNRRNVFRVAIAYIIAAWVVAQVADLVLENIGAPQWVMQTVLLMLAIGFIFAVIIAWVYEVTPDGIKREADVPRDASTAHHTGKRLNYVTIGLVVVAIGLLASDRLLLRNTNAIPQAPVITEQVSTPIEDNSFAAIEDSTPVVAVLPFKAAGSEDGGFLAGGLHDDLLTRLAKLGAFSVISRTSMMEYAGTTKNMRQIGEELGARYILEGGIQALGNRVRVNAQLIDAPSDEHVWADTYDRELTAANLFDIQSDLAYAIAAQLQTALSDSDQALIDEVPTQNIEAYNAYLRGLKLRDTGGHNEKVVAQVIEAFEQATGLDPQFALAWAQLSIELSRDAQASQDPAKKEPALAALTRAEQLQPGLYEVELARIVYLYRVQYEYQQALDALDVLEERHTVDASALMLKAFLLRRMGRFEDAYQTATAAKKLDPRSIQIASQLINMAWEIDDCDASNAHARAAMALASDNLDIRVSVAHSELQCNGDAQRANALLKDADFNGYFQILVAEMAANAARDWAGLLAITKYPFYPERSIYYTFEQLEGVVALRNLKRIQESEAQLDSVNDMLEALEDNPLIFESRFFAMAKMFYSAMRGDPDATRKWLNESKQRQERESKGDQSSKVSLYTHYARALATAGLHSEAIEELRLALESPGGDRFPFINSLPVFDVLKDHPDYIALQQRFAEAN